MRDADRDIGKRPCKFTGKNRGVEVVGFFYARIDALMREFRSPIIVGNFATLNELRRLRTFTMSLRWESQALRCSRRDDRIRRI
jgi:hypothetical protein